MMLDWTQWLQNTGHIFIGGTIGALLIAGGAAAWFRLPVVGKYVGLAGIAAGAALIWGAVQYDVAAGNCKEAIVRAQLAASQNRVTELERQIDAGKATLAAASLGRDGSLGTGLVYKYSDDPRCRDLVRHALLAIC
jgi:hypothetical protein